MTWYDKFLNVWDCEQKIKLFAWEFISDVLETFAISSDLIIFYLKHKGFDYFFNANKLIDINIEMMFCNEGIGLISDMLRVDKNRIIIKRMREEQELSGVDMISSGLGIQKVVVRGLSGMRIVTYLNGMQINNQQWANDHGIGFTDLGLSEVELIKGASALKYGSEAIGGLLYFKDAPFIANDKLKGFISTGFNNSSLLSNSKFGVKFNKKNLFFNLYGQYAISSDYRLPDNTYLFNSRFKQNAIKFSLGYRSKNWQNIFRAQIHNEFPGIPGHVHGDPSKVDINAITSIELDLAEDFSIKKPWQVVNNKLLIYFHY